MYMPFFKSLFTLIPVFTGVYTDFSTSWHFNISGMILITVAMNVFLPVILTLLNQMFFKITACCDRDGDCTGKKMITKTMTRYQFLKIHVGPEFPYELRYSSVILIYLILCSYY